jgi:signal transduction histidine kinase
MSTPTSFDERPGARSPSRFLLPLGLPVVVVVVLEAALGPVGLGTTGRPLLLTASTAVYAVTGALLPGRPAQRPATSMTLLALMAAAALVMHAADPDGPAIGLFLVAAFAPLARVMAALEDSQAAQRADAAEAERARLAADVHDVPAHTLSGLALQLEGATLLAATTPTDPRLVEAVRRAHRLSRRSGYGLSGMAERVRAVGGRVAGTDGGSGFRVHVAVP